MYHRLKQLVLMVGDVALLYAGLYLALVIRSGFPPRQTLLTDLAPLMGQLFAVAILLLFIVGLYDVSRPKNRKKLFQNIIIAAGVWVVIGFIFFYLHPLTRLTPKTTLLLTALFGFGAIGVWRTLYNRFVAHAFPKIRVVFAGFRPEVAELIAIIQAEPERGYSCLGVIPLNNDPSPLPSSAAFPAGATLEDLIKKQTNALPDIIVAAPHMTSQPAVLSELYQAVFKQVSVVGLAEFYEQLLLRIPPFTFSEAWFVTHLNEQRKKMYDRFRILTDYTVAIFLVLMWLITFPFIALGIKLTSAGPILFKQTRIGRGGAPFTIIKYRTMRALSAGGSAETNGPQFAAENDTRITSFGRFLRRTHLDELPQALNIIRGEMGLIGPRPERPEFVAELTASMPFYTLRHLIKPGLTGWAQLEQSYYGTIPENLRKLEYDLFYVKNRGPLFDLMVVLKTINLVLKFNGR